MSREREFLDIARRNLRVAASAVKLAHDENPDRGSLTDIERDIIRSRDSCSYLIDIIGSERTS